MSDLYLNLPLESGSIGTPATITGISDAIQLLIKGFSTQTNFIFEIQKSDGTNLLAVNNLGQLEVGNGSAANPVFTFINEATMGFYRSAAATLAVSVGSAQVFTFGASSHASLVPMSLTGVTDASSAAATDVGRVVTSFQSATNAPTSSQYGDLTSIVVPAGDWDIWIGGEAVFLTGGAIVTQNQVGISTTSGNSSTGLTSGDTAIDVVPQTANNSSGFSLQITASFNVQTTYYLKMFSVYSVATPRFRGRITARRRR